MVRGRKPLVMDESVVLKLKTAFMLGLYVEEACAHARISRTSFYNWIEKGEEVRDKRDDPTYKPTKRQLRSKEYAQENVYLEFLYTMEECNVTLKVQLTKIIYDQAMGIKQTDKTKGKTDGHLAMKFLTRRYPQQYGPGAQSRATEEEEEAEKSGDLNINFQVIEGEDAREIVKELRAEIDYEVQTEQDAKLAEIAAIEAADKYNNAQLEESGSEDEDE